MRQRPNHWWYPLTGRELEGETVAKAVKRSAHMALFLPRYSRVRPADYVWFYAAREKNNPVAVGVVQVGYQGTDDRKDRVVVALHRKASDWLAANAVGLSVSSPSHAPRQAFQDVNADDARRLMDSGIAPLL
jgi:hypothetical protein